MVGVDNNAHTLQGDIIWKQYGRQKPFQCIYAILALHYNEWTAILESRAVCLKHRVVWEIRPPLPASCWFHQSCLCPTKRQFQQEAKKTTLVWEAASIGLHTRVGEMVYVAVEIRKNGVKLSLTLKHTFRGCSLRKGRWKPLLQKVTGYF